MTRAPAPSTDAWGITSGYVDALGAWQVISEETRRTIRSTMCADETSGPEDIGPIVLTRGERRPLASPGELVLEDGAVMTVTAELPPDLPLGYHVLHRERVEPVGIIVSPGRCHLPPGTRAWGWAVQLYAARSSRSWGIGDLADLRRLAEWSARELGARLLLVNPLHAPLPILPQQASPYFPSTRRYRNPLYIRVEDVPGAREAGVALDSLATAGRALNAARHIDRDAVFRLKRQALERIWSGFRGDPRVDDYATREGRALEEFAVFCALAERHGSGWREWPAEYRSPTHEAVCAFEKANAGRVRFHIWLQWLLDEQLARASEPLAVMQDLPIGVDPNGADAWAWQDVLATGVSVGAPPDRYNVLGQDWGLPPFIPHRLRRAGYEPFVQTIRATLRHAGGLRVDHVMGLFRLFWIPRGAPPAAGAFVRYPADDLLDIVALESHRAGAFVVGEDLGTVEAGVRARLAEHGILSYRLFWFETEPPLSYPRHSLAAITTHDLPTIAGLWTGSDTRAQRGIGLEPNEQAIGEIRERLREATGVGAAGTTVEVIERAHALLATAPSALLTATLDDALGVEERPNMPGTTTQWPNWSIALPQPLEMIETEPLPRVLAQVLGGRGAASLVGGEPATGESATGA